MNRTDKHYLEQLIEWGKEVRAIVENANFPEEKQNKWSEQLELWLGKVYNQLNDDTRDTEDSIHQLKVEGEKLLAEIENDDLDRKEIQAIPYGHHQLPPLPYAYDALEPYISETIMRLHHDKHHRSYVEGLNDAEKALYTSKKDIHPIKYWLRNQAFNGSGHYLHTIFWYNMTPNSSLKPSGHLLKKLERDFGSWSQFQKLFTKAADSVEGNGWAVLLWAPRSGKLCIQTFEKHQLFQLADTIPLLVLDVWEHAYYLQYKTDRKAYIENWWHVVNWDNVSARYNEAKKVTWTMF